jgi:hypothetical protein
VQILLGVEAWLGKYLGVIDPATAAVTKPQAFVRCAHVLVGYGVMSTTVVLAVLAYRGPRPAVADEPGSDRPLRGRLQEPALASRVGGDV